MASYDKIIFLDIDGALNGDAFLRDVHERAASIDSPEAWKLANIDPRRVELLNRIIEETGAKVVLSSSWRQTTSLDEMQSLLEQLGFVGELVDETPQQKGMSRRDEIEAWLQANDVRSYVVVDDDLSCFGMRGRIVHTSARRGGLIEEDVDDAVAILEE